MQETKEVPRVELPSTIKDALLPYQKVDIDMMTHFLDNNPGTLNFNCRGAGKTLEAISTAVARKATGVVVIVPNRLKLNWAREIEKWTGESSAVTTPYATTRWGKWFPAAKYGDVKIFPKENRTLADTRWFITNHEQLRTETGLAYIQLILALAGKGAMVIIDEAHRLRNPDSKMAIGSNELPKEVKKLIMTGTPLVNSAFDYYQLLHLTNPEEFDDPSWFLKTFTYGYFMRSTYRPSGQRNQRLLKEFLSKIGLQRIKEDILPDLPPMTKSNLELEMEGKQLSTYKNLEEDLMVDLDNGEKLFAPGILAKATRLRQVLCDPRLVGVTAYSAKTEALIDIVDPNEQTVIFTAFEKYVGMIIERLEREGFNCARITGKESTVRSNFNAESFQKGNIQVLVGTLKAMNEGIDLYAGHHCVFTDKWWNAAVNEQAEDRLHRIGLTHPVRVTTMMVEHSFDHAMQEIIQLKKQWGNETEIRYETIDLLKKYRSMRSW